MITMKILNQETKEWEVVNFEIPTNGDMEDIQIKLKHMIVSENIFEYLTEDEPIFSFIDSTTIEEIKKFQDIFYKWSLKLDDCDYYNFRMEEFKKDEIYTFEYLECFSVVKKINELKKKIVYLSETLEYMKKFQEN